MSLPVVTLVAALAAGRPFLTTGTFSYSASLGGVTTGTSTLNVARDGDSTKIDERASGTFNGLSISATAHLTVGADLAPARYDGAYQNGNQKTAVTVALTPSSATVVAGQSQPQSVALQNGARHFVVIEPGLIAGLFALPAEIEAWKDSQVLVVAPAFGQGEPLPVDTAAKPDRPQGVPAADVAVSFGGRAPFTIWYDPTTFVPDEVVVPSQNAIVTRVR